MIIGFLAFLAMTAAVTAGVGVVITGAAAGVAASVEGVGPRGRGQCLRGGGRGVDRPADGGWWPRSAARPWCSPRPPPPAVIRTGNGAEEARSSTTWSGTWRCRGHAPLGTGALVEVLARSPAVKWRSSLRELVQDRGSPSGPSRPGPLRHAPGLRHGPLPLRGAADDVTVRVRQDVRADNLVMLAGLSIAMTPISPPCY